jgi:hypothetical protein
VQSSWNSAALDVTALALSHPTCCCVAMPPS